MCERACMCHKLGIQLGGSLNSWTRIKITNKVVKGVRVHMHHLYMYMKAVLRINVLVMFNFFLFEYIFQHKHYWCNCSISDCWRELTWQEYYLSIRHSIYYSCCLVFRRNNYTAILHVPLAVFIYFHFPDRCETTGGPLLLWVLGNHCLLSGIHDSIPSIFGTCLGGMHYIK